MEVPGATSSVLAKAFVKGQSVTCTVTVHDGTNSPYASATSSPLAVLSALPAIAGASVNGQGACAPWTCVPHDVSDADGDPVSVLYRWFVGGVEVQGATAQALPPGSAAGGQSVACAARGDDGTIENGVTLAGAEVQSPCTDCDCTDCEDCAGCEAEPVDFALAERMPNATQVRLSNAGLDFIEDNAVALVGGIVGGLDPATLPIAITVNNGVLSIPLGNSLLAGADLPVAITLCPANNCQIDVTIPSLTITPVDAARTRIAWRSTSRSTCRATATRRSPSSASSAPSTSRRTTRRPTRSTSPPSWSSRKTPTATASGRRRPWWWTSTRSRASTSSSPARVSPPSATS